MFSVRQKREIADAVQKILRATNHPELPKGEIKFTLHVDGAELWSWADIRNNGDVPSPDINNHNEMMDKEQHELDNYRRLFPTCDEHKPEGTGCRGGCLICAYHKLEAALSRIDYLCGEPNEMEVSGYDVHKDEDAVVKHVERRLIGRGSVIDEIEEYLSQRADADQPSGEQPIPNEEMVLLTKLRDQYK